MVFGGQSQFTVNYVDSFLRYAASERKSSKFGLFSSERSLDTVYILRLELREGKDHSLSSHHDIRFWFLQS